MPMHPVSAEASSSKQVFRKKRDNLPKEVTCRLRKWLDDHEMCPYPSEREKLDMAEELNLSVLQINNWFINSRRRYHWKNLEKKGKDPRQIIVSRKGPGSSLKRKYEQNIHHYQSTNCYSGENNSSSSQESGPDIESPQTVHKFVRHSWLPSYLSSPSSRQIEKKDAKSIEVSSYRDVELDIDWEKVSSFNPIGLDYIVLAIEITEAKYQKERS